MVEHCNVPKPAGSCWFAALHCAWSGFVVVCAYRLIAGFVCLHLRCLLITAPAVRLLVSSLQAANDFGSAGKADAAWQYAAPDTANSCDSSGSAQQEAV